VKTVRTITIAGVVMSALLGAVVGIASYTAVYAESMSYLSNDPRACVNCHVMREQYDGWQKTSHHAVASCNDCHVPHELLPKYLAKADHGWRHSKAFTLQDFHEPIRITPADRAIVIDNCRRCHEGLVSEIDHPAAHAAANGGHGEGSNCVHCHAHVGHGPRK
jgi:cytochrome c nitrite reductase small subunit